MRRIVATFVGLTVFSNPARGHAQDDRVVLERTACLGSCPVYTVEINRKGVVTFTGKAYVLKRNGTRQLEPTAFRSLISYLDRSGFFNLKSTYLPGQPGCTRGVTDTDSATLSVFEGRRSKSVSFYYGCLGERADINPDSAVRTVEKGLFPPAPHDISLLADLAIHVDSMAGTDEWAAVPGGPRTKPLHNHVFIGREREMLRSKPAFLSNRNFGGVQITYPWAELERARDEYDFSTIRDDLALLKLYLGRVYGAAKNANVGVGGPDLMPFRSGQLKSSYPLIRQAAGHVPSGIAVQDGNLEEINPNTRKRVTAKELLDFALNYLKVDYIFWGTQEPYFSSDVVPTINRRQASIKIQDQIRKRSQPCAGR
ncbi:MAG: DUF6438 domain-containing protein [Gemmatimonadaceae bacterium]